MARIIKKRCVICDKEYNIYCPTCSEAAGQPSWKQSFCSENCKEIYHACAGKFAQTMTTEEARMILDACDLSQKNIFRASARNMIKEIYGELQVAKLKENIEESTEQSIKVEAPVVETLKKEEEFNNKPKYETQKPVFKPKNKKNR